MHDIDNPDFDNAVLLDAPVAPIGQNRHERPVILFTNDEPRVMYLCGNFYRTGLWGADASNR